MFFTDDPFIRYPCPVCGHLVFEQQPGSHKTCPICLWEDNLLQLRFPLMPGGVNTVSLEVAQQNYQKLGVAERIHQGEGREPLENEAMDEDWRILDTQADNIEEPSRGIDYSDSYPIDDTSVLYYWRDTYWRRFNC